MMQCRFTTTLTQLHEHVQDQEGATHFFSMTLSPCLKTMVYQVILRLSKTCVSPAAIPPCVTRLPLPRVMIST